MQASEDFHFSDYWDVVDEIVEHMSIEQKIGHITLIPLEALHTSDGKLDPQLIQKYHLGALFTGGSEAPDDQGNIRHSLFDPAVFDTASAENYQKLMQVINQETIKVSWNENGTNKTVYIPLLVGTDSVHGNQHVLGSILFPHNIGLACAHDPDLIYQIGYWTAYDSLKSGFNWIFAPTTNRALNYQWGRSYETLGLVAGDIERNSAAFVHGAQAFDENNRQITGALTTTKHFLGLGNTFQGADEGNVFTNKQYEDFVAYSFPEYRGAIKAHTGSIMCAYNAVDNIAMSINERLLHNVLKEGTYTNMPYDGFVVSDYEAVTKVALQGLPTTPLHTSYEDAILRAVRAGLDMLMIGGAGGHESVEHFQSIVRKLVDNGSIPMYRLDDAVKRILAVKYAMGLLQRAENGTWLQRDRPPMPSYEKINKKPIAASAAEAEQEVALQAAQKSLVLLKNESKLLPLNPHKLKYIILLGQREVPVWHESEPGLSTLVQDFDNIGAQNGGWTVCWQGIEGNRYWQGAHKTKAHATSLLDGLSQFLKDYPNVQLLRPQYSSYTDKKVIEKESDQFLARLSARQEITSNNSVIIVTLAESPYAEYMGDINISYCQANDQEVQTGCLYNHHLNPYMPKQQRSTLRINWDPLTEAAIGLLQKRNAKIPLLTILFSGRPMIITEAIAEASSDAKISAPLPASTAFIAAWLPGTSGGAALANAIFGKYLFRSGDPRNCAANTLAVDWIKTMKQLENFPLFTEKYPPKITDPLFPVGYGLATYAK